MAFANENKEATMMLYQIGKGTSEKPVFQRAGFNFVSYDGDPDRFLEPLNACVQVDTIGPTHAIFSTAATRERISGFEFLHGRLSEVHAFYPEFVDVS